MTGIRVQEIRTVNITTTNGQVINKGDNIVICVKGQDVVCEFVELDKAGYFVTKPLVAGTDLVKYRLASITKCYKVTDFMWDMAEETAQDSGPVAKPAGEE